MFPRGQRDFGPLECHLSVADDDVLRVVGEFSGILR